MKIDHCPIKICLKSGFMSSTSLRPFWFEGGSNMRILVSLFLIFGRIPMGQLWAKLVLWLFV